MDIINKHREGTGLMEIAKKTMSEWLNQAYQIGYEKGHAAGKREAVETIVNYRSEETHVVPVGEELSGDKYIVSAHKLESGFIDWYKVELKDKADEVVQDEV